MWIRTVVQLTLLAILGAPAGVLALEPAVAVSPASQTGSRVQDRCPTFIWSDVPGAEGFELVIYRIADDGEVGRLPSESPGAAEVVLRQTFSGGVDSWKPSLGDCLERGTRYAWSVRAVGPDEAGPWSSPGLFQVTEGPSSAELEHALAVVRAHLEAQSDHGAGPDSTSTPSATGARVSDPVQPEASLSRRSHLGTEGGIVVNGVAAETKADPPCYPAEGDADDEDRFVDCGNGTVLDTVTGLLWLKDANCLAGANGQGDDGRRTWYQAVAFAAELSDGECGLSDHSQAGDWRLPTQGEWEAVLDGSCSTDPELAGKAGGCYSAEPWASNVQVATYWSSTTRADGPSIAKTGDLPEGFVAEGFKNASVDVWPVRDGQ